MRILLVSPYHGGSHRAWAESYRRYSQQTVTLLTLPACFWKWRMHGGAVTLARRFLADGEGERPHLVLATDMLDLTTFVALTRRRLGRIPLALYMHENQLTYPLPEDGRTGPMRRQLGERDRHYAFVNYVSMLTADLVLFNSRYHQDSFLSVLPRFLKHFPEYNELNSVAVLREKSRVLPVGVDFQSVAGGDRRLSTAQPPLVVWNQRWEYDKNPGAFFAALYLLAAEGIPFRLALCGQQFGKRPPAFEEALDRLSDRIVHVGYAEPDEYAALLWEAAVTASTAHHEFFGVSILEAIYCHTFPILPHRLSYPELMPQAFHERCLYHSQDDLVERLRWALRHPDEARATAAELGTAVADYDWSRMAPQYDTILTTLAGSTF